MKVLFDTSSHLKAVPGEPEFCRGPSHFFHTADHVQWV